MTTNKVFAALGLMALTAVSVAQRPTASYEFSRDPSGTLFKAMDVSRRMNVEAIVMRSSYSGHASTQCKFEQSYKGVSKFTVLAPICDQGAIMYDNGRVMKNYIPDDKKLLVHDSMRNNAQLAARQSLAEQNYRFSTESGDKVAGRATMVIVAIPRSSGMPSRRYSLDVANMYLLRVETDLKGDRKTLSDTKAISYPRSINVTDPERDLLTDFRRVELESPVTVHDLGAIFDTVGFKPAIPGDLPFGFAMLEKQVDEGRGSIAFRISDGLANATIFQRRAERDRKSSAGVSRREVKGFEFKLIGDLPDPIIARLLDVFVREVLKGLNPLAETSRSSELLDDLQTDEAPLLIAVIIEVA